MNPILAARYEDVEVSLIGSPVVIAYDITRKEIGFSDGKFRVRLTLIDNSSAEFFEYATESNRQVRVRKYSSHWQDEGGVLRRRWDNAPHHLSLPNSPHHVHEADGTVHGTEPPNPDLFSVLALIEEHLHP